MMLKKIVVSVLMVVSLAVTASAADAQKGPAAAASNELEKPYAMTRKDWLELSLPRFLQTELSTWSQKIEYKLVINEATQAIEVTLWCSNGSAACKFYVEESCDSFKMHLDSHLKRYEWARLLKVVVSVE